MKMNPIDWIAFVLVVIGGLNWGLYGLFNKFDLVKVIFQEGPLAMIVYILVGLAALYYLVMTLMKIGKQQ